jgi:hypothetical protein
MSTLISELDSAPALGDGDFVQNILAEMNGGGGPAPRQVISAPTSNTSMAPRVMDNAPATAHVIGNSQPSPGDFAQAINTSAQVQASNGDGGSLASYSSAPSAQPQRPALPRKTWTSRIMDEFRTPFFVVIIVFVFSLPVVNFLFAHYVPAMVMATGQLTTIGLLVKSMVAGASFWLLQRVVVPLLSL